MPTAVATAAPGPLAGGVGVAPVPGPLPAPATTPGAAAAAAAAANAAAAGANTAAASATVASSGGGATTRRAIKVGKYVLLKTLGKGSSSEVKLAQHCETGEQVAVKVMSKEWVTDNGLTAAVNREISLMASLKHRNVVELKEVMNSERYVYMVMELVRGRELYDEIVECGTLPEGRTRRYFRQIVEGLSYLHSQGVVHRDLKPENILLSADGSTIKITDFGLSATCGRGRGHRRQRSVCGTPYYTAPEVFTNGGGRSYDARRADVWSAGVVLYTMLAGQLPFDGVTAEAALKLIASEEVTLPPHFSPEARDLVSRMLTKEPSTRIALDGVLRHPFLTGHKLAATPIVDITVEVPSAFALVSPRMQQAAAGRELLAFEARAAATSGVHSVSGSGGGRLRATSGAVLSSPPPALLSPVALLPGGGGISSSRSPSHSPRSSLARSASPLRSSLIAAASAVLRTATSAGVAPSPQSLPTSPGGSARPRSAPFPRHGAAAVTAVAVVPQPALMTSGGGVPPRPPSPPMSPSAAVAAVVRAVAEAQEAAASEAAADAVAAAVPMGNGSGELLLSPALMMANASAAAVAGGSGMAALQLPPPAPGAARAVTKCTKLLTV